mmetsp:Transcript_33662/g.52624  ORF Transcript_33662/g.52624 Transcript_33662/m.52624 type:complete len:239 (-) Transcript_33662:90-806(-)|eukprot:CAMPEP_0201521044 /NCGR_PEP_ID=MMETSP0161_2-20130828/13918_1 /ASSEMBLY_ACC=CAM_ASM_000251 /TAXON_ID=180227 /ORGANISM="Neoparamoeba aestuarina, Strain SoJaBio B1-5/56/2" /LENGTH=238 /DNA_ID=CAMNT_0047919599 /DNA_START=195 /DNA_END=911 /DNA_ORIENTATION=+
MKLLEVYDFEQLCGQLNQDVGGVRVEAALEAFSCKPGSDRKLYKSLDKSMDDMYNEPSLAPQGKQTGSEAFGTSPFGPMSDTSSRKTFIFLVATLNGVFPDYDFSHLKVEDFSDESNLFLVVNAINTRLQTCSHFSGDLQEKFWSTLDRELLLKECEVYSFLPDPDSDPFYEEGSIWNINYFFYNRKLKRVAFFQCRAIRNVTMSNYGGQGAFKAEGMMTNDDGEDWGDDPDLDFMMD